MVNIQWKFAEASVFRTEPQSNAFYAECHFWEDLPHAHKGHATSNA
jgi:hypothetical protein